MDFSSPTYLFVEPGAFQALQALEPGEEVAIVITTSPSAEPEWPFGWSESSKTLTTFHPFPRLPIEVRLMVWKLATIGNDKVPIRVYQHAKLDENFSRLRKITRNGKQIPRGLKWEYRCTSPQTHHALLKVCKESHCETLSKKHNYIRFHKDGQKIPFAKEIDTLFFDNVTLVYLFRLAQEMPGRHFCNPNEGFEYIQHVAVDLNKSFCHRKWLVVLRSQLFPAMKSITFGISSADQSAMSSGIGLDYEGGMIRVKLKNRHVLEHNRFEKEQGNDYDKERYSDDFDRQQAEIQASLRSFFEGQTGSQSQWNNLEVKKYIEPPTAPRVHSVTASRVSRILSLA